MFMAHAGERVNIGREPSFNVNPGRVVVNVTMPDGRVLLQAIGQYIPEMTRNRQIKIHSNALITN